MAIGSGGAQVSFNANDKPERKAIKQYGLQRSGTNYSRFLLTNHYHVDVWDNRGGWKHGFYRDVNYKVDVLVTVKNPYDWIISLHKYSNHPKDLSEYIRGSYNFEGMQGDNPMAYWNTMNKHWYNLEIPGYQKMIVRYEDLLKYPEDVTDGIAKQLGFSRNKEPYYIPEKTIEPNSLENTDRPFDKDYYLKKGYLEQFSSADIEYINSELDEELMKKLGYKLEIIQ